MNPRALSIIANVALTVLVLQANVLAQENRDAVSTADPAQEGFSAQRLGEMEKAIQNGDFKSRDTVVPLATRNINPAVLSWCALVHIKVRKVDPFLQQASPVWRRSIAIGPKAWVDARLSSDHSFQVADD